MLPLKQHSLLHIFSGGNVLCMFISSLSIVAEGERHGELIKYLIFVHRMPCMFSIHYGADSVAEIRLVQGVKESSKLV